MFEFLAGLQSPGTEKLIEELGQPDNLPEGPEVETYDCSSDPAQVRERVESILEDWERRGVCVPSDVLILHLRSDLESSRLGNCEALAGHRLVDYLDCDADASDAPVIAHTSIQKAKGLDSTGVVMVGMKPFRDLKEPGYQHAYFMGASRAKQALGVVHC